MSPKPGEVYEFTARPIAFVDWPEPSKAEIEALVALGEAPVRSVLSASGPTFLAALGRINQPDTDLGSE